MCNLGHWRLPALENDCMFSTSALVVCFPALGSSGRFSVLVSGWLFSRLVLGRCWLLFSRPSQASCLFSRPCCLLLFPDLGRPVSFFPALGQWHRLRFGGDYVFTPFCTHFLAVASGHMIIYWVVIVHCAFQFYHKPTFLQFKRLEHKWKGKRLRDVKINQARLQA